MDHPDHLHRRAGGVLENPVDGLRDVPGGDVATEGALVLFRALDEHGDPHGALFGDAEHPEHERRCSGDGPKRRGFFFDGDSGGEKCGHGFLGG